MKISEMIEVLQAYERGEKIEVLSGDQWRVPGDFPSWNFHQYQYRIAPKKELSLVEELREADRKDRRAEDLLRRVADRICELERVNAKPIDHYTTDELLDEIKRRMA